MAFSEWKKRVRLLESVVMLKNNRSVTQGCAGSWLLQPGLFHVCFSPDVRRSADTLLIPCLPRSLRLLLEFLVQRFSGVPAPWDRCMPDM